MSTLNRDTLRTEVLLLVHVSEVFSGGKVFVTTRVLLSEVSSIQGGQHGIQWNLQIVDTLGRVILSIIERLSSLWRSKMYYHYRQVHY